MDRKNVKIMVDLTGGYGGGLREVLSKIRQHSSERFIVFTEPAYTRASEPGYAGGPDKNSETNRRFRALGWLGREGGVRSLESL